MRNALLLLILVYQKLLSPIFKNILGVKNFCLYVPSCSEYAKHMILRHGCIKGSYLALLRILSCQSFINRKTQILKLKTIA
ncbi:MAG: membrane protein insertion efficiency factor YidD [Candidatus Levybacteria bacterium]|nr:membrane protein insertion efficiency factor YidD [Candidatus Levybacteria bacterium]